MSEAQSFNLARWLTRLGYKRTDEPELVYSVQPVQVVSDVSGLTPALLPPSAGYGGTADAVAAEYGTAQFQSLSPGGTLLTDVYVQVTSARWMWRLSETPHPFDTGETAMTPQVYQGPILGVGTIGSSTTILPGDKGFPRSLSTTGRFPVGTIFVPSGQYVIFSSRSTNANFSVWWNAEELPAMRGT